MASQVISLHDLVGRMIRTENRVGFTDCDPYGHLASGRYLEMAINHRMSAVTEQLGFDTLRTAKETGVAFVNKEVNLKFQSPAQFDEWLVIQSWIDQALDHKLVVKVWISKRDSGKIVCKVTIQTVTFDINTGVPVPIPRTYEAVHPVDIASLPWAPGHPKNA